MRYIKLLYQKLTQKALEQWSGESETGFFESSYRIAYFAGISFFDYGLLYKMYKLSVISMICLFVAGELWYLLTVAASLGLDGVIETVNVIVIHLIVIYRYRRMDENKRIYKKLAASMESTHFDISTPRREKLFKFWVATNDKYFKGILCLGSSTLAVWYIYPLVDDLEYNLVAALRLPFEYRSPALYPVTYVTVLVMFHYISYFVIVNDLFMPVYLVHLLCQFSILGDCFENIMSECNQGFEGADRDKLFTNEVFIQKFKERLEDLVKQHQFILNNAMELRKILSAPMLCQMAASAMLICLAGYQVTASVSGNIVKSLSSIGYLSYNMSVLYVMCRLCDEIKMQSESIGKAVYFSGWERGIMVVPGVRTRVMLVVARTARPIILTAGGLCDLSLMSYTKLVKTSYSALTILLRMR